MHPIVDVEWKLEITYPLTDGLIANHKIFVV
jgi:hypothetical protein